MSLAFELRSRLRWRGLAPREIPGDAPDVERARSLISVYGLGRLEDHLSRETWRESLGWLDVLDRIPRRLTDELVVSRVLDLGAKNWRYLPGLASWLESRFLGDLSLTGIELDLFRMDAFTSRLAWADHYIQRVAGGRVRAKMVAADLMTWNEPAELVFWLLPFVLEGPHRAWGLPLRHFNPDAQVAHVADTLVAPGGLLILANQGRWERDAIQSRLSGRLKLLFESEVEGSLHPSPHSIFLTVWTREA